MKLKVRFLKWSTGAPVALLNNETAEKVGVHSLDRVVIKTGIGAQKQISTIVNTIMGTVRKSEIAVSCELRQALGLKSGQEVDVVFAPTPNSLGLIKKKLENQRLKRNEIKEIIQDVVGNSLSDSEIALFVSAMYRNGMSMKETVYLIEAMIKTGNQLDIKDRVLSDKHSIGGIPGNRTTPLVVSICAAAGLTLPKTSSRAITSPAGTADVIETIAKVEFSMKDLKKIIYKTNACLIWGGALGVVPADEKIIKIEKVLKIDPRAQLLASIMSKKIAMGSKYVLIDIPFGKGTKVSKKEAKELQRKFVAIGKHFHMKVKCVLTDGKQPIGNGIGPVLELIDILRVLEPKIKGPKDLEEKSIFLSGKLLELAGRAKKGKGELLAREMLYSGRALEKFKQIIKAQGGSFKNIKLSKFKKDILSTKSGEVKDIDNKLINSLARTAGCPADKQSGLYLYKHLGDKIKKGEPIVTLYAESKARLNEAEKFYRKSRPIKIG